MFLWKLILLVPQYKSQKANNKYPLSLLPFPSFCLPGLGIIFSNILQLKEAGESLLYLRFLILLDMPLSPTHAFFFFLHSSYFIFLLGFFLTSNVIFEYKILSQINTFSPIGGYKNVFHSIGENSLNGMKKCHWLAQIAKTHSLYLHKHDWNYSFEQ